MTRPRDLPPLPPRGTRGGVYARRLLMEDPDINHDAFVGRVVRPVDHRVWARVDVVTTVEDTADHDGAAPLPPLADRVRVAIAPRWPDGFGPTPEGAAAILAAAEPAPGE